MEEAKQANRGGEIKTRNIKYIHIVCFINAFQELAGINPKKSVFNAIRLASGMPDGPATAENIKQNLTKEKTAVVLIVKSCNVLLASKIEMHVSLVDEMANWVEDNDFPLCLIATGCKFDFKSEVSSMHVGFRVPLPFPHLLFVRVVSI
jgi:hypothetical protein